LKKELLEDVLVGVRSAAHEAGALVLSGFRKRPEVEHKGTADLVTEFDRASEALLRERLQAAFPAATIIGEEQGWSAGNGDDDGGGMRFYVDPVDGTTNFVHGHPFWCVSIGLVVKNTPVLGVVLAPSLATEWFGYVSDDDDERLCVRRSKNNNNGASETIIEEECRVSPTMAFVESLLATGFPYEQREKSPDNNFDAFIAIKKKCQAVRRCGSAALDLCLVADGTYEGYWERKLRAWDVTAGIALVRAAGGRVTDFQGRAHVSIGDRNNVVATNGRIHEELLRELASFV